MRALFEDQAYAAENTAFEVRQIGRPATVTNLRDYWLAVTKSSGSYTVSIEVYRTRSEAQAAAGNYIGSWSGDLSVLGNDEGGGTYSFTDEEVTVTNAPAEAPSTVGLDLVLSMTVASATVIDSVWGYTCAPDLVTLENLRDILLEYTGSGQSLEVPATQHSIPEAKRFVVGPMPELQLGPQVALHSEDSSILEIGESGKGSTGTLFVYEFTLVATVAYLKLDFGSTTPLQESYEQARQWQANIASILWDERDVSEGEMDQPLVRLSLSTPEPFRRGEEDDSGLLLIGEIRSGARYTFWTESRYPRT